MGLTLDEDVLSQLRRAGVGLETEQLAAHQRTPARLQVGLGDARTPARTLATAMVLSAVLAGAAP
jgi:hypothetical protein